MKHLLRFLPIIIGILITVVGRETAVATQRTLTGQDALNFLQENGIYNELPPQTKGDFHPFGREFFLTGQIGASDGGTDDQFSISVARDGDTVLVGVFQADIDGNVDQGAAYIYKDRGNLGWVEEAKLIADDGAADDQFGLSVALDGDTAVIGAHQADNNGNIDQGAAYVFTRSGVFWDQAQKLITTGGSAGDEFGRAVALVGSTALIGAPADDVNGNVDQGAAYVFSEGGGGWGQTAVLISSDTVAGDGFGRSVALDGNTALIGAPFEDIGFDENQGAAYVFANNNGSWSQQARLVAGDGAEDDEFGGAVALDGDTALVGAHLADIVGNSNQGAAYVYTRSGESWSYQDKIAATDGLPGDRLGRSVSVQGDTALVGAPRANIIGNSNQGAAYVFFRSNGRWYQQSKLTDWTDGEVGDRFGRSVVLDGDTALVGAIYANLPFGGTDQGAVYSFARSPIPWLPDGEVEAADGANNDLFGYAVDLDGETAVVGAHNAKIGSNLAQGSAYIFERSVNTWVQVEKLTASTGSPGDWFGFAVAIDGDTVLISAPRADINGTPNQGAAYIFTRTGTNWIEQTILTATDGTILDNFGGAVTLDGNTALVGASLADVNGNTNQGAAYVFTGTGNNWNQQAKLTGADGAAGDEFGISVSFDGNTSVIGASSADMNGNDDQGAAYIFTRTGSSWSQQGKLVAADGAAYDVFGEAVAVSGDTALVGSRLNDIGSNINQGAAYIFTFTGGIWSQQARLTASDGVIADGFGFSVALAGNTALVGAFGANINGKDGQGAAYIFANHGNEGWVQQAKLRAYNGAENDYFGFAVAMKGNIVLVGATEYWESAQGKAYFFLKQPFENFLPMVVR